MLRIFAFTAGSSLTAQQPLNNAVRTSIEALAAVLGGVQTLHVSGFDEALGVPTREAAMLGLRTQQVILEESGVAGIADALGGSWAIEALTDELANRVWAELGEIDKQGGALACIENGYFADRIADGAYRHQIDVEAGQTRIVGVNCYQEESTQTFKPLAIDPAGEREQRRALAMVREQRDTALVEAKLQSLRECANAGTNIVPATIEIGRAHV